MKARRLVEVAAALFAKRAGSPPGTRRVQADRRISSAPRHNPAPPSGEGPGLSRKIRSALRLLRAPIRRTRSARPNPLTQHRKRQPGGRVPSQAAPRFRECARLGLGHPPPPRPRRRPRRSVRRTPRPAPAAGARRPAAAPGSPHDGRLRRGDDLDEQLRERGCEGIVCKSADSACKAERIWKKGKTRGHSGRRDRRLHRPRRAPARSRRPAPRRPHRAHADPQGATRGPDLRVPRREWTVPKRTQPCGGGLPHDRTGPGGRSPGRDDQTMEAPDCPELGGVLVRPVKRHT